MSASWKDYQHVVEILAKGNIAALEEIAVIEATFPYSEDNYINSPWILTAIACGAKPTIEWMLARGADLNVCDAAGCTVAIARRIPLFYSSQCDRIGGSKQVKSREGHLWLLQF